MLFLALFITAFTAVVTQDLLGVSYYFDNSYTNSFSDKKCENSTRWELVSYEYLELVPPYQLSSNAIKSSGNSCTSSFPIVFFNGTLELTVFLRTVSKYSGITIAVFDDEDNAVEAVRYQRSNKNFVTGWTVVSLPIKLYTTGFIRISGQSLSSELIIIDSLRYIPGNTTTFDETEIIQTLGKPAFPTTANALTETSQIESLEVEFLEVEEGSGGSEEDEDDIDGSGGGEPDPEEPDPEEPDPEEPDPEEPDPEEPDPEEPDPEEPDPEEPDPEEPDPEEPDPEEPDPEEPDPEEPDPEEPDPEEPDPEEPDPEEPDPEEPDPEEPDPEEPDPEEPDPEEPDPEEPDPEEPDPEEPDPEEPDPEEPDPEEPDPEEPDPEEPDPEEPDPEEPDPEEPDPEEPDPEEPDPEELDPGFWNAFTITLVSVGAFVVVGSIGVGSYYLGKNRGVSETPPLDIEALEAPSVIRVPRVRSIFSDAPSERFSTFS